MTREQEVDLDPDAQNILREWRELIVEHYASDIERLSPLSDPVCGFEIEYDLLQTKEALRMAFHETPLRVLEFGTRVMLEQFQHHNVRMRPVLRIVRFPRHFIRRVDELRMRDRNTVVCLDVKVNDVSHPYGWLKTAVHQCDDCGGRVDLPQRRARERVSPNFCFPCFEEAMEGRDKNDPLPRRLFRDMTDFSMVLEECRYEDIQDLSLSQITINDQHHVLHCSPSNQIVGTVADDLVGEIEASTYIRVNGIVRVQPIPDRTFAKDTRRLLSLDVLSVEPLSVSEG